MIRPALTRPAAPYPAVTYPAVRYPTVTYPTVGHPAVTGAASGRPAARVSARGRLAPVALLLMLGGCAIPLGGPAPTPQSEAQRSLVDACRRRADEAYDLTHRGDIYASESQVNTPFSANYQPGLPDRGLSTLYEHDQMVSDCVRNTGAEGSRVPPGTAQAPPPPQH